MDLNTLRALMTLLAFVCFVAIVFWAYSSKSRDAFAAAAQLPFDEDEPLVADNKNGEAA